MSGTNTTIDDVDSRITYSNSPAWNTNVWAEQEPQPYNGTNHGTPNPGATATLTFEGTAIYVYGFKGSDHGYRDISIDERDAVRCDGRTGAQGSQALVYWADNLSPGTHTITFTHTGTQGQYLNLDYFAVTESDATVAAASTYSYSYSSTTRSSYPSATVADHDHDSHGPPIGLIAGGVAGGAVLILLIAFLCSLYSRKQKKPHGKPGNTSRPSVSYTPLLPQQGEHPHPADTFPTPRPTAGSYDPASRPTSWAQFDSSLPTTPAASLYAHPVAAAAAATDNPVPWVPRPESMNPLRAESMPASGSRPTSLVGVPQAQPHQSHPWHQRANTDQVLLSSAPATGDVKAQYRPPADPHPHAGRSSTAPVASTSAHKPSADPPPYGFA